MLNILHRIFRCSASFFYSYNLIYRYLASLSTSWFGALHLKGKYQTKLMALIQRQRRVISVEDFLAVDL
jgi:hypothetical protein